MKLQPPPTWLKFALAGLPPLLALALGTRYGGRKYVCENRLTGVSRVQLERGLFRKECRWYTHGADVLEITWPPEARSCSDQRKYLASIGFACRRSAQ